MNTYNTSTEINSFATAEQFLQEWNGHRRLTRRVIDAFPEDKLFDYSIGGMRTFAEMVKEIIDVSGPGVRGIATDNWKNTGGFEKHTFTDEQRTKEFLLALFDEGTEEINNYFVQIGEARFQETVLAFGAYEGQVFSTMLYFKDNEIHHRAQGTVYLRSLGIEPPAFYDRS
ncbi:MAG: damage-inducible protein DinB [Pedobacter sp.]|nr:MAG: damage-inducible protein DinB [Pedobacter sp.]